MEKRGGKERENKKMARSSGRNGKESNGKEMKDGGEGKGRMGKEWR